MLELPIANPMQPQAATLGFWRWLLQPAQRRDLRRLRWRVLQRGEPIELHWQALKAAWQLEPSVSDRESIPDAPKRLLKVLRRQVDPHDRTIKLLLETRDSQSIEAVLIPSSRSARATACLSSQVGCGVKCSFCATGRIGLQRNLTAYEILEQLLLLRQESLRVGLRVRNVVFMGMGEPFHNWANVRHSIQEMMRDDVFYLSGSHICVSTAGVVHQISNCAREFPSIRIAVSLHSCDPEIRKLIVPRGVGSLGSIRQTIVDLGNEFPERTFWLEIVLLDGVTDREKDIEALKNFCRGLRVEINLIPYNESIDSTGACGPLLRRTRPDRIWQIARELRSAGLFTTVRNSGGQNIAAACGQLAANPALQTTAPNPS